MSASAATMSIARFASAMPYARFPAWGTSCGAPRFASRSGTSWSLTTAYVSSSSGFSSAARCEPLPQELHGGVDVVEIDLREGVVDEPDVVPEVVLRGDVLLEDDVHVLRLALLRLRRLGHVSVSRRRASRRRAARARHPGAGS